MVDSLRLGLYEKWLVAGDKLNRLSYKSNGGCYKVLYSYIKFYYGNHMC